MVISMTGFGRSVIQTSDCLIQVEIKTVNHRYREYFIKMPHQLSHAETEVRNLLGKRFNRGRIELTVKLSSEIDQAKELHIDWTLMDRYYHFIKEISERFRLPLEIKVSDFLQLEDAIQVKESDETDSQMVARLLEATEEAAKQVLVMRQTEGASLSGELESYIFLLESTLDKTKELAPLVQKTYTERLRNKLFELVQENIDETRLAAEAAIFADKVDISEELTRLSSHISQFRETMLLNEPIGRKLDFIIQEMNREVNTIGSKGNDGDIAMMAVEMKVLIEKMREQVQNIE